MKPACNADPHGSNGEEGTQVPDQKKEKSQPAQSEVGGSQGAEARVVQGRHARRRSVSSWPLPLVALVCGVIGIASAVARSSRSSDSLPILAGRPQPEPGEQAKPTHLASSRSRAVIMPDHQQRAVGLKVTTAASGTTSDQVKAPGRVAADQEHFAFITPRAAGVVRSVAVNIGQQVHAGDVLAAIDSPAVGRARLELRTQLQLLEVAKAQASWQAEVYDNTLVLVDGLKRGDEPDAIQKQLEGRPVGTGRERLMTAYAQYRLASAAMTRNENLFQTKTVSRNQFQTVRAAYEAASASYQALLDSTAYEARMANLRSQQALRQAETARDVARDQLEILGVDLKEQRTTEDPLSTYALVAPFDGTILDRTLIVPGVSVDITSRLFTIADLSTVWLEVSVSEGDFDALAHAPGGDVCFESPAYPGQRFAGRVLYRGDLVDEASRSVKLLAAAPNPDRLLKPGMFVEVTVQCPGHRNSALIPDSALVTADTGSFVFVRTAADRFERRAVTLGGSFNREGESQGRRTQPSAVAVTSGLKPGEVVVVEGTAKLEAKADASAKDGGNG